MTPAPERPDPREEAICAECGHEIIRPWIDGERLPWKHWAEPQGHRARPRAAAPVTDAGLRAAAFAASIAWDEGTDHADDDGFIDAEYAALSRQAEKETA